MRVFAGIDSGTQSTKVLLVAEDGRVVGRGASAYELIEGLPIGHKEQHPETWIRATSEAFRAALAEGNVDPASVAAIGVSGQQHGFVPLGADGAVLRPAKLWCDTSTAAECAEIMGAVGGPAAYAEKIGNLLPTGFTASKILWMKKHHPELFARLGRVLLPHDYLNWWMTGVAAMECGDASGTGLLDVRRRVWREEVIVAVDGGLRAKLPNLIDSSDKVGNLTAEVAAALGGLRPGIPVSAGGGDNMMGAIGTGNVRPGVLTVSLGTSGTIYAFSAAPVVDPKGEIAAFCDSTGNWLPLLCTMNVTVATELARGMFGLTTAGLNEAVSATPAGAEGLMLIPYFEGERTPDVPNGTGVWFGSNAHNATAGHFCRAAMEGATLGLNYGFRRLRELGVGATEVRLTGGGSKSPVWRQLCADVFGVAVVCTTEPEGAALGAALQARWMLSRQEDPSVRLGRLADEWVRLDEGTRCLPDGARHRLYGELQERHDALSREMLPAFARHRRGAAAGGL
jgi:D-xylulose kinase